MTIEERITQLGAETLALYRELAHWEEQAKTAGRRLPEIRMLIAEKEGRAAELLNIRAEQRATEEEHESSRI